MIDKNEPSVMVKHAASAALGIGRQSIKKYHKDLIPNIKDVISSKFIKAVKKKNKDWQMINCRLSSLTHCTSEKVIFHVKMLLNSMTKQEKEKNKGIVKKCKLFLKNAEK